jgi:hypothetical protein
MVHVKRSRLSPTEKNDIWSRWKAGQSMHAIGRAYVYGARTSFTVGAKTSFTPGVEFSA